VKLETVREMWLSYWRAVQPPGVRTDDVQYQETRRSFYAGVFGAITAMGGAADRHATEQEGCEYIDSLYQECLAFKALVKAGKA
jgi:hypothetical protein